MSSGATSNAAAVKARIEALVASINFTSPGRAGSLGKDLLTDAAVGIRDHAIGEQAAPDGTPWEANRGKYGERKEAAGLPVGVGLRSKAANDDRRMLSLEQVKGRQEITPDSATMTYGTDDRAMRVAGWFTVGGSGSGGIEPSGTADQPGRPFYALNPTLKAELVESCREAVRDIIRRG